MKNAILSLVVLAFSQATFGSIALDPQAPNKALMISVAGGLPGLDIDLVNMKAIFTDSSNQFQTSEINNASVMQASTDLAKVAQFSGEEGTFAFYYTGHGSKGSLALADGAFKVEQLRMVLEKAREKVGPMARLILIFDSCYSGTMVDPIRADKASQELADHVTEVMTAPSRNGRSYAAYWKELFVFASALPNETCLASINGSLFTEALKKSWDQTMAADGTIGDFIALTKAGTKGSHPMERLVPASMAGEKLGRP